MADDGSVIIIGLVFGIIIGIFAAGLFFESGTDVLDHDILDDVCDQLENGTIYYEDGRGTSGNFVCIHPIEKFRGS